MNWVFRHKVTLATGSAIGMVLSIVGCVGSNGQVMQPAPLSTSVIAEPKIQMPTHIPVSPTVEPISTTTLTATPEMEEKSMEIRLRINDREVMATLVDSETTRDFISLLPLKLILEDYAGTEKISSLPQKLSTEGAPAGSDPSIGDITYYAPWGNLAIFYRDFGYANGLIILGHIDGGIEELDVSGSIDVTIELVD